MASVIRPAYAPKAGSGAAVFVLAALERRLEAAGVETIVLFVTLHLPVCLLMFLQLTYADFNPNTQFFCQELSGKQY